MVPEKVNIIESEKPRLQQYTFNLGRSWKAIWKKKRLEKLTFMNVAFKFSVFNVC